jgi:hypothetical protein
MNWKLKIFRIFNRLLIAFICLIVWQGCFKFRTSDPEVLKEFSAKNRVVRFGEYPYEMSSGIDIYYPLYVYLSDDGQASFVKDLSSFSERFKSAL